MKKFKKNIHIGFQSNWMLKLLQIMKLTTVLLLITTFQILAEDVYSQSARLTLNLGETNVGQVLKEIENKSEFYFLFNQNLVDIDRKVNISIIDKKIDEILEYIFKGTDIAYVVIGKQIVLSPREYLAEIKVKSQPITISGLVTGEGDLPLPGVSIIIKGTTTGTITDLNGKFSLEVPAEDAVLVFTYVGYNREEFTVGSRREINVMLIPDITELDEVLVIGYGVQKKSNVTGAISSVGSSDLQNRSVTNVSTALQGKSAGVQVMNTSGAPGRTSSIRIRGISSNKNSEPLYIVDGLIIRDGGSTSSSVGLQTGVEQSGTSQQGIGFLDPENIESIEILKDAASAAIYGAEAGNGVILITTKSGKKGQGKMFYNGSYTVMNVANKLDVLNAEEYVQTLRESGVFNETQINRYYLENPSAMVNGKLADVDWQDEMFTRGYISRHTLGFQGGNDRSSLYISLGYLDNDGIITGSQDAYQRFTGQFNGTYNFKDWLDVGTTNSYEKSKLRQLTEGDLIHGSLVSQIYGMDPVTPVEYSGGLDGASSRIQTAVEDGHFPLINPGTENYYGTSFFSSVVNPMALLKRDNKYSETFNLNGTLYANLKPLKGLVYTSRLGYRFGNYFNYSYTPPYWMKNDELNDAQGLSSTQAGEVYYQWENFATYNYSLKKNEFSVLAGMSFINSVSNMISANTDKTSRLDDNFLYLAYSAGDANDNVSGTTTKRAQIAYFGRLTWDYANKYNLQFNFRADSYSSEKLDLEHNWGYFPSVSGGWTISNESFMDNVNPNVLSFLKVRASYGINGSISNLSSYQYAASLIPGTWYYFVANEPHSVISPSTALANPLLRWEESAQFDAGIDIRLLDNRLNVTADYYNKNTDGLLINSTANLTTGSSTVWQNVGIINNHGFEFEFGWKDKIGNDFSYNILANLGTVSNEVTEFKKDEKVEGDDVNGTGIFVTTFEEGYPVWYLSGYKFKDIDDVTGEPIFEDMDPDGDGPLQPDGVITVDDKTYIGDGIPDFTYGVTVTLNYRNFDLLVYGTGSYGADIMYDALTAHATNIYNKPNFMYDDRWTPENTDGTRPSTLHQKNLQYLASDAMVFDGSYFKIKQIQLGYNVPASLLAKIRVSALRAYISLENFFTFTSYPGLDPEIRWNSTYNMALDGGGYPVPKSVMFGVNLTF